MHNKSPMLRTKYTKSSQQQSQLHCNINNSKKKEHNPLLRALKASTLTTLIFISINTFGIYTHYHDDLFAFYYPFPFAIDVGHGPSMLPTLNPQNLELYLRDVFSHRHCGSDNSLLLGNSSTTSSSNNSNSNRNQKYKKGDVVTIYNPHTKSIVTKRIVGMEGDIIRLFGEHAVEFGEKEMMMMMAVMKVRGEEDTGEGDCGGGVPLDVRFDPPFCQQQASLLSSARNHHQEHNCRHQDEDGLKEDVNNKTLRNYKYEATMQVPPNHIWVEGDNPLQSTDSRHYGPLPMSALRGRIVLRLWPLNDNKDYYGHHHDDGDCIEKKMSSDGVNNGWFYKITRERPIPPFQGESKEEVVDAN